ncbi:MAG: DUF4292 domain-containing protein, partial [Spirochaetia bacterium]|nr:DUF4292 domain-containing protein [Spirochaetia bacterium]
MTQSNAQSGASLRAGNLDAAGIRLLAALLLFSLGVGCTTPTVQEEKDARGLTASARLALIKANYKSPVCSLTKVKLEVVPAAGTSQSAKGAIRADNAKNRMHMAFMDPYFGLTISELTVTPEKVYISGMREKNRSIPTDRFQVRGMGNNSIALPFTLFQDLLYGRIPETVYKAPAHINKETDVMTVDVKTPDEESRFEFKGDRLV